MERGDMALLQMLHQLYLAPRDLHAKKELQKP